MASTSSDTELLTEHFGYPPVSLLDDIINTINILAERALNSVEQGLLAAPPASLGFGKAPKSTSSRHAPAAPPPTSLPADATPEAQHRHEIESGTHQLETLLCASIDRNFDLFELYVMRNILCVKPQDQDWIRLAHYDNLDLASASASASAQQKSDAPTTESVAHLRRRLQASQQLNLLLRAEQSRNEDALRRLRAAVSPASAAGMKQEEEEEKEEEQQQKAPLAFLSQTTPLADSDAQTPLGTTTAFTLSQLQALRALSTSLRGLTPDLTDLARKDAVAAEASSNAEGGAGAGRQGWRAERVGYVEAATRSHLESVRGLELGATGAVRDGEWQGEGRAPGPGEVEGLETVATLLGAGREGKGEEDNGEAMDES